MDQPKRFEVNHDGVVLSPSLYPLTGPLPSAPQVQGMERDWVKEKKVVEKGKTTPWTPMEVISLTSY